MAESKRVAWVNIAAGRAMVIESDDRMFFLEVRPDGTINGPFEPGALRVGMWLQPACCILMEEDPGAFPYEAAQAFLIRKHWLSRMVGAFVIAIEVSYSLDLRGRVCRELSEFAISAPPEATEEFRQILLVTPWPEGAETRSVALTGRAAEIFAEAVTKHGHAPS